MTDARALLDTSWTADDLAVYADALIERGDPRGEVIALDLARATAPDRTPHYRAAVEAWLGPELAALALPFLRFGFLEDLGDDPRALRLLASPLGELVRSVRIENDVRNVQDALERLAAAERPFLRALTVHLWSDAISTRPRLDEARITALIAATPQLRELDLSGKLVAEHVAHPRVERVRLSGADALADIRFPAAVHLDLAMHRVRRRDAAATERVTLARGALPALRTLDLSRNEPGVDAPIHLGGNVDAVQLASVQPVVGSLDELVLPSVLDDDMAGRVIALASAVPGRVRIARLFRGQPDLERAGHPRIAVPSRRPWPHVQQVRGELAIVRPTGGYVCGIGMRDTCLHLDAHARASDDAVWAALWAWYTALRGNATAAVPLELMRAVLAAGGEPLKRAVPAWRTLAGALDGTLLARRASSARP